MLRIFTTFTIFLVSGMALAGDGNRLAYLDDDSPYYPSRTFPKLITPQWIGEEGVDAVVILAIDDMRGHERWEAYLRPILNRLKKIDGRAPVSIMTCQIDPKHEHLQKWLKEGVSLEVHTLDHPCPLLRGGDFNKAKATYDGCVDLLNQVPGNKPVAFRMPCCDSQNTVSPRFFAEIFNKRTAADHFLQIDSSVCCLFTGNDPELPRELVFDADGRERFRKYLPANRTYVNYIEDYPYPYVVNRLCWEFPCITPSDWQGQNLNGNASPITLRDWKAALDCVVIKKGVFSAVFHPYEWMKPEQVVDFIDYAVTKYGKRVKFLTFKEALERLNKHLVRGQPLRKEHTGEFNFVQVTAFAGRSFANVQIDSRTHLWQPESRQWLTIEAGINFPACAEVKGDSAYRLIQIGDRRAFVVRNEKGQEVLAWMHDKNTPAAEIDIKTLNFSLPPGATLGNLAHDTGLRFIDIDGNSTDDIVFSNEKEFGVYLFTDMERGWSTKVMAGKAGEPGALPPIARDGKNNGFFVHGRALCWQNETTDLLPDLIYRVPFNDLLKNIEPTAKSPEASLKSIQTAPGFRVELMAAEPLVQDPVAFAFGPDGKLWVVEMGDYPRGAGGNGKHGGRVRFLEDANGDGVYDKSTLFLDDLHYPTSVLPWRNGILLTSAPDILFVENVNGKPGKREVLFTGFTPGNPQHRVNTLAWGLDKWIYVANGDSGGSITSTKRPQTPPLNINGRDLRIRPDTGEMEAQSGQTQFGRSRDDWGNWFGGNNADPMWHFALDDHYLRRNPFAQYGNVRRQVPAVPGVAPVYPISRTLPRFNEPHTANRFTSACSPIVYRDELFSPPANTDGSFAWTFVSEPVHNLIHRELMAPLGATFRSQRVTGEERSEFLASSDNWFRPTMIQIGPDGCLWIADMYRYVIEHPEWIPPDWQQRLDLRAGHDKGRIYRVVPVHAKPRAIPRLDQLDTPGLVAALDSPSGWQRDMAHMMLVWKNDPAVIPLLEKTATQSQRPLARLHALCVLDGMNSLTQERAKVALADPHPGVRCHAVRLCERWLGQWAELPAALVALLNDRDDSVRMQLASSLGESAHPSAGRLLGQLALTTNDPLLLDAVYSSMRRETIGETLRVVVEQPTPPTPQLTALVGMATRMNVPVADSVIGDVLKNVADERGFRRAAALAEVLGLSSTSPQAKALFTQARTLVDADATEPSLRSVAMALLGRSTDDHARLARFLWPQVPAELQSAAVNALARGGASEPLIAAWRGLSPAHRSVILQSLLQREAGIAALLDALEQKRIDPADIDPASRQFLTDHRKPSIKDRATKILAGLIDRNREQLIESYRPALNLMGNAERGKVIFAKTCANCHRLGGIGNEVGPDLAALAGRPPEYLLIAILDPNRAVESRYVAYTAETRDGRMFNGVLSAETSTSITLVGTDGKPQSILRADLESLTSTGRSAMPEGLEKDLKPQNLADLLAHLRGSRPAAKPKAFPGNQPAVVKAAADGSILLPATTAEIYGPSLVFEQQYGNLGYWSHADDHAAWTVQVAKSGPYDVFIDYACAVGAGGSYAIDAGAQSVRGTVADTGNWDTYRQIKVGTLSLHAGEQRVVMRPDGPIRGGAMIDLRTIRLVPAK